MVLDFKKSLVIINTINYYLSNISFYSNTSTTLHYIKLEDFLYQILHHIPYVIIEIIIMVRVKVPKGNVIYEQK